MAQRDYVNKKRTPKKKQTKRPLPIAPLLAVIFYAVQQVMDALYYY